MHLFRWWGWLLVAGSAWGSAARAEVSANLLKNPSFEQGADGAGTSVGWQLYGSRDDRRRLSLVEVARDGRMAIRIEDGHPDAEIGLLQGVGAKGGVGYKATVWVREDKRGDAQGAFLQMRFLPSQHFAQKPLMTRQARGFEPISVSAVAPSGTTQITVYIYTHRGPTPRVTVDHAELIGGVDEVDIGVPPPAESPNYSRLKDLHLITSLVRDGKPEAVIVAPASGEHDAAARRLQEAIRKVTGVVVPIVGDEQPASRIRGLVLDGFPARRPRDGQPPLSANLICLGQRTTNQTIGSLYDLYYCLTDAKYPGRGGYEVRTLHDPFGDGRNVILVGGSDSAGVDAAADRFISGLDRAGGKAGVLEIGRLMDIRLGDRLAVPKDIRQVQTWESSDMYGSVGYFGWNTISKRMALYYMTGDESHAREFLRLAFPDAAAKRDIADIDGEMIENKDAPLSGPYHYNAHMMILFWDLIEDSPIFSDEHRLRITNAFSQQLQHRRHEGIYGRTSPPEQLGSRHGQLAAISLYCLGRYFQTGYPAPVWRHCVESARTHFEALHQSCWIMGELDNLYWYNTGMAPILTYIVLTGDRQPVENGVLGELLRGQEALCSGMTPDWALNGASLDFLHKAAYVTGDGRWLTYRRRTRQDVDVFRLGQSFWPPETLRPCDPDDLVGRWTVHRVPQLAWRSRKSGLPLEQSFFFASYRSEAAGEGDFILLDGFNGASRNPYHAFAILELRLAGVTVLRGAQTHDQGYLNQVLTRCDGMVEPRVAMDAALRTSGVLGRTAFAVGKVPGAAFCNWRRTLAQRVGRYALVIDDLTPRIDSENLDVQTLWQSGNLRWDTSLQGLQVVTEAKKPASMAILACDLQTPEVTGGVATLTWRGAARKDRHRVAFSLIAPMGGARPPLCRRIAENAASLACPMRAIAVVGRYEGIQGDAVILGEDHVFGLDVTSIGLGHPLLTSDRPVRLDWDLATGRLEIAASGDTTISLASQQKQSLTLATGSHVLDARPDAKAVLALSGGLDRLINSQVLSAQSPGTAMAETSQPSERALKSVWSIQLPGPVSAMEVGVQDDLPVVFASEGAQIHAISSEGKGLRTLRTDGKVRVLRWWDDHGLLLAGCSDEKVIAFDRAGRSKWTFVSEMDPAVFAAAKQYWFKSAHPGIHGLFTGVFLEGKSQAFVGSACTLEILDENGKLVRRRPVFWGPGNVFQIVDASGGGKNLLVGRKPNDGEPLAIISNRTLNAEPRGFYGVPAGHTYVGGWDSNSRHHLFYEDLDGSGKKRVISEINGVWNRVGIWAGDGTPVANAQFGPGPTHHSADRTMRDITLADLDGDGRRQIVVGLSGGLVVALDSRCQKRWAVCLPSPPTVLEAVTPVGAKASRVVVACQRGEVCVLDGAGKVIRRGSVQGRPCQIKRLAGPGGATLVVIATESGQVSAMTAEEMSP